MSTILASSLPDYARSPERPDLGAPRQIEIVSTRAQRSARPRMAYALIAVGGIFLIFLAQLGVSIALSDGAYKIAGLNSTQRSLAQSASAYNEINNLNASPQALRKAATGLKMVTGASSAFINAETGKVTGDPVKAGKDGTGTNTDIPNNALAGTPASTTAKESASDPVVSKAPAAGTLETNNDTINTDNDGGSTTAAGAPAASGDATSIPSTTGALPSPVTH